MINEAFLVMQERICQPEDLDPALMAGLGMRKGPLALAAEIGLGDCLKLLEESFAKEGERFRPAPLLKRFVWAGRSTVL
jgi:3-hydroxybutyryl-CoA dehydrogenase